jgi:hypothetical protein
LEDEDNAVSTHHQKTIPGLTATHLPTLTPV